MNIVKSGIVNGKQRHSIIDNGKIVKSSYDKHKLQDYLNPPILDLEDTKEFLEKLESPVCDKEKKFIDDILDLDNPENDKIGQGIQEDLKDKIEVISNTPKKLVLYIPKGLKASIFPIGDLHIGSEQFNEQWLDYWFSVIAKSKNYIIIYLMGDILEVASKKVGDSAFRQKYNVNKQLKIFKEKVEQLKNKLGYNPIRATVSGNHDKRLLEFDYSLNQQIAEILEIARYDVSLYDTIIVNDKKLKIHLYHGKHTNKHQHLREGAFIRDTHHKSADLFLEGHNHDTDTFSDYITGDEVHYRRFFGFTGSALNYNGYAKEQNLREIPKGFIEYEIYPNGGLNGKEYHSDLIDWEGG